MGRARTLRRSNAAILGVRQRYMVDWSGMPIMDSLIDEHPLSGTSDEDFEFGISRMIEGFEALLRGQSAPGGSALWWLKEPVAPRPRS
jgi:hypothetical protein